MRVKLLVSVLVVMGLVYGLALGWRYAIASARTYAEEAVMEGEGKETARISEGFDLGGATRLTIENAYGSVEVKAGGPQVTVERTVYAGGDTGEARARAARFTLAAGPDGGDGYKISVRGQRERPRVRVDLAVEVPPQLALSLQVASGEARVSGMGSSVTVSTGSGGISVESIAGPVAAKTGSGDILVKAAQSGVTAATGSGDIELTQVHGPTDAKTGSGSVMVRGARGDQISLKTASGSLDLTDIAGQSLVAESASGSIQMSVSEPFSGEMRLRTASGSISLALPAGSDCRLDASTASGSVSSSLPLAEITSRGRSLSGRLGAGKGHIEAKTASGSVELKQA